MVDGWNANYEDDGNEVNLIETFSGLVNIEKTNEQKYLGYIISSKGDNMANIIQVRNKSIGIIRKYWIDWMVQTWENIILNHH